MSVRAGRASSARPGSPGSWTPYIDAISVVLLIVAVFVFLYFAIAYRYLDVFFKPATIMLVMLASGLALGIAMTGARVAHDLISLSAATGGVLAAVGLFGIQLIIANMSIPAQGVSIVLSPFWLVLFYMSVGVAEEAMFTLFMFGTMIRVGIHPLLAAFVKSAFFVIYHNWVAIQMFSKPIFQVTNYSLALYIGSFLLTLAFYYTRFFSVPALGHGMLNAIVQIQAIGMGGA